MLKRLRDAIFILFISLSFFPKGYTQTLPKDALIYLPVLQEEIGLRWTSMNDPWVIAGQIEQETCPSLRSQECWNPHAEMKTYREYGFGLGQLTVTSYFNAFNDVKSLDQKLKPWKWEDRFDPTMQLRSMVDMDYADWLYFPFAETPTDQYAFMLAAYNGGPGGTMLDIKYCEALPDCLHRVWFNNVETHSHKSRTSLGSVYGGQSAYNINRDYVNNVLHVRMQKYEIYINATDQQ